jgi:Protein of unknown function (DUF2721).
MLNEGSFLGVLSSMITPAVLILASGQLILTTSQRLSRVIERVRKVSQEFLTIERSADLQSDNEKKRRILYSILQKSTRRCKYLTLVMTFLYLSLSLFVATSFTIGIIAVVHGELTWIPTALGMLGSLLLFASSAILIIESRLTYSAIGDELDYVIQTAVSSAPERSARPPRLSWRKFFRRR